MTCQTQVRVVTMNEILKQQRQAGAAYGGEMHWAQISEFKSFPCPCLVVAWTLVLVPTTSCELLLGPQYSLSFITSASMTEQFNSVCFCPLLSDAV